MLTSSGVQQQTTNAVDLSMPQALEMLSANTVAGISTTTLPSSTTATTLAQAALLNYPQYFTTSAASSESMVAAAVATAASTGFYHPALSTQGTQALWAAAGQPTSAPYLLGLEQASPKHVHHANQSAGLGGSSGGSAEPSLVPMSIASTSPSLSNAMSESLSTTSISTSGVTTTSGPNTAADGVWHAYHHANDQLVGTPHMDNLAWRIMALNLKRKRELEKERLRQEDDNSSSMDLCSDAVSGSTQPITSSSSPLHQSHDISVSNHLSIPGTTGSSERENARRPIKSPVRPSSLLVSTSSEPSIIIPADDTYRATLATPFTPSQPSTTTSATSSTTMPAFHTQFSTASTTPLSTTTSLGANILSTAKQMYSPAITQDFPFTFGSEFNQQLRSQPISSLYPTGTSTTHAAAYATLAAAAIAASHSASPPLAASDKSVFDIPASKPSDNTKTDMPTTKLEESPVLPSFAIGGTGRGGDSGDGGGGDDVGGISSKIKQANKHPDSSVQRCKHLPTSDESTESDAVDKFIIQSSADDDAAHTDARSDITLCSEQSAVSASSSASMTSSVTVSTASTASSNVDRVDSPASTSASLADNEEKKDSHVTSCHNCETTVTPLWRRDSEGRALCNACGLFLKLHGILRPKSLKTNVIKKRNRRPRPPASVPPSTLRPALPHDPLIVSHYHQRPPQYAYGRAHPGANPTTASTFDATPALHMPATKRVRSSTQDQPGTLLTAQPLGTTPEQNVAMAIAERLHQQRLLAAARLAAERIARAEERHGGYYAGHALAAPRYPHDPAYMSVDGFWFSSTPAYSNYDEFGELGDDHDVEMH